MMPNYLIKTPAGNGNANESMRVKWSVGDKGGVHKTGSLTRYVIGEDKNTDEESIRATTGLPQLYQVLSGMRCTEIEAKDDGPAKHPTTQVDSIKWKLDFSFDNKVDVDYLPTDPLTWPVKITRDAETEIDRLVFDAETGALVATAAGEPIDIPRPITMPVFTFVRYEPYPYPDSAILALTNGVNDATFRGAPIGTVLMVAVRTAEEVINDTKYEKVSYVVKFKIDPDNPLRTNTWKAVGPHRGTWYKNAEGKVHESRQRRRGDWRDFQPQSRWYDFEKRRPS